MYNNEGTVENMISTYNRVNYDQSGGIVIKKQILPDGRICATFIPKFTAEYIVFLGIRKKNTRQKFWQVQIEEGYIPSSWKYPESALAKQSDLTSLTNKVDTNTTNITNLTNKVNTNTTNISDLDNKKQDKSDNQLKTSVQTVVGGINELKERIDSISTAVPVGSIQIWPGDSEPNGYMICNGAILNKDEYDSLFRVIGYTYGRSGDDFKIPNMQGRFVAGKDGNYYNSLGKTGGESYVTLTAAQSGLPAHTHSAEFKRTTQGVNTVGGIYEYPSIQTYLLKTSNPTDSTIPVTVESDGGTGATVAHENRPPFIVMNYIIKVK